jgi:PEP-CTERM motif
MKLNAIIVSATMALAGAAQAATIGYTFNAPTQSTDFTYSGSLGTFDSTLGTLTGATLTLNDNWDTQFSLQNTAAGSSTFRYTGSTDLGYTSSLAGLDALMVGQGGAYAYNTGSVTLASGASRAFGPYTDSHTASIDLSSLFAALSTVGAGSFNIDCSTLSGTGFVGGGNNITATQQTNAGCGAAIAYTYTVAPAAVPLPGSIALLGLGLAGFAAARRRSV